MSVAKADSAGMTHMFKVKQQMQDVGMNPDASPIVMHFLTRKLPDKDISAIQRQIPNKGFVERWRSLEYSTKAFTKQAAGKELTTPSAAWKFLLQSKPEDLLFAAITSRPAVVEQRLKNFLTKWPLVKQKLPFVEMAELKITSEHPEYRKIMGDAFLLLLDGKLRNHNEIIRYLEPYKPPEPPPPPPPVRRGRVARKEAPAAGADQPKKRGRKPKALINVAAAAVAAAPAAAAPAAVPAKEPAKADAKAKPPAPAKQKHAPPKKAEKARKPAKKADKKAAKKDKKKGKKK